MSIMDENQYIYGIQQVETDQVKEVKMRLPVGHLIRLHSLKLIAGENISETVSKALTAYFEKTEADKRLARTDHEGQKVAGGMDDAAK